MRLIKTILNYLDNGADKYLQSLSSEKSNRRPNVAGTVSNLQSLRDTNASNYASIPTGWK